MYLAKVYGVIWILSILILLVTFLTGFLSSIVLLAFGKFFVGLIFMGLIGVIPSMAESFSPKKR
ncbi:MAG: hypothetical protein R2681_07900 [Pyrinomonadaceae bacterium]